ncbi:Structural maintenance of chromosomes protein 5 [Frankliniella fusca]|uniref:Structural maintenance of chromosomes protein 5 n=1 Tax=Frankliniella fusca TaxID=407009 RepID=A0AAE1I071_9NEOP|nr:Structural maintenance of chromosomes protein 5 [Frankliniella fusca]
MARGVMNGHHNGDDDDNDDNHDQAEEAPRREGSIVKIRMKDFITYDSVECFPGESLNVVIGPNGTGKSTILSAIVLGLGGKPTLLGKPQAQIQDFIKNQRQEAEIEIELLRHRKNTVIKRTIFKSGKSIWHLNGRQVNAKDIEAEMKALNIQVDNLCQVLAQDRVQDFAKLNKQELLAETQKAIGKEAMADIHANLKALQREQKNLELQIEAEKKKRDVEQSHVDRLQGVVDKIAKRRHIENEADICKLKLSILQYKSKKDEADRYKEMKKTAEAEVKKIDAQIEPFKKKIDEAEEKFRNVKNRQSGMDKRIRNQLAKVSDLQNDLENARDEILDLENEKEKQLKSTETQQQKEDDARQTISRLKNDIAAQEKIPVQEIASKIAKLKADIAKFHEQINQNETRKANIGYEIDVMKGELQEVDRELSRVQNQRGLRMSMLREINNNAAQAVEWVEANRNLFSKPVYLPMLVELDVNPQFARYVETAIGYNDLIAFVCESAEDTKIIIDNCRKRMGLRVNVLQSDAAEGPTPEPSVSLENLRRQYPRFEGYLIDFVKGPSTLLHFLCRRKGFNSIPVSRSDVEADTLPRYYSGDYSKGHTQSRFGGGLMYSSDPIASARFFKQNMSDVDEDALRRRANEIQQNIAMKEKEKSKKQEEINHLSQQRKSIRDEASHLETSQTTLQTMKFQLGRKEKDLVLMLKSRIDPEVIKEQFAKQIRDAVLKLATKQEPFFQSLKELDNIIMESQTLDFDVQNAKAVKESTQRLCSAEQEALEAAKRNVEAISTAYADRRKEASDCLTAITRKHNKNVVQLWGENEHVFATLPNTLEDLETHIEDQLAHAEMLGGGNDGNQLREFEQHVNQLDVLTRSIATKETQATAIIANMETRESEWKRELNELVDTISTNFSRYFAEMKCAGEVTLFTGNSEHDYDNYGLRVRVKFRDEEQLQDLNAHTQSGGERAVSTAIYMLALQELTPAPFRLVDEINQGMDAINERRVYELLLRSTSRPGTPQYFLLTPKLLKEMQYNPGTTVLCVMNSACAPNHKTWDVKRFIALRKNEGSRNVR